MNFSSGPAVFEVMLHRDNTLYVLALTPLVIGTLDFVDKSGESLISLVTVMRHRLGFRRFCLKTSTLYLLNRRIFGSKFITYLIPHFRTILASHDVSFIVVLCLVIFWTQ